MSDTIDVPCPECKTPIPVSMEEVRARKSDRRCPSCGSMVRLDTSQPMDSMDSGIEKFRRALRKLK